MVLGHEPTMSAVAYQLWDGLEKPDLLRFPNCWGGRSCFRRAVVGFALELIIA